MKVFFIELIGPFYDNIMNWRSYLVLNEMIWWKERFRWPNQCIILVFTVNRRHKVSHLEQSVP